MKNDRKPLNSNTKSSSKMSNVKEITDGTSKLKISNNAKRTSPQSQPHNKFEEIFPQLPEAHVYNPYKIMGFQNKETNEFAMNVLKAQATNLKAVAAIQTTQMISQSQPNIPLHASRQNRYESPPQPPIHHIYGTIPQPPPPIQNFVVANVSAPVKIGPPSHSTYGWNFKIGDRCLAKYWEDENVSQRLLCFAVSFSS